MKGKIFNTQEVKEIMAGNKRMFRKVIKVQPTDSSQYFATIVFSKDKKDVGKYYYINDGFPHIISKNFNCPYQKGQKIFVKESFSTDWVNYDDTFGESCVGDISYEATWEKDNAKGFFDEPEWKPASQMKQEHSRLTLQIKEITVERLQDINEEDCINEGFDYDRFEGKGNILIAGSITNNFAKNWNAIHKKPEEKFEANPWVWVVDFEVAK